MRSSLVTGTRLLSLVLALCAASLFSSEACAQERVAVLGLRAGDGLLGPAAGITRALRDAARNVDGWQVVSRDESLSELMSYHACRAPDARCMTRIGLTLGADRIVYGTLRPAVDGNGLAVTLYAFDSYAARLVATVAETVAQNDGEPVFEDATLANWVTELSARRLPRPGRNTIEPEATRGAASIDRDEGSGSSPLRRAIGWSIIGAACGSAVAAVAALRMDGRPAHAVGEVLGGAAVLTAIVGVVLLLTDDADARRQRRRAVEVSADLGPEHAEMHARVAF